MGATRHSETIEALWASIIPKNFSVNYQNDEVEQKLCLLLKSTEDLVTGIRQKELAATSQLDGVTNQLTFMTERLKMCESENKGLQKDVSQLQVKLQSAEDTAKKFQNEAEAAAAKCERLQAKMSSEVENLLLQTFKKCLRLNKAATVQDMMTQMYPETQLPESGNLVEEHVAPKESVMQPLMSRNADVGSPEVIQATPPHCKEGKENNLKAKKEKRLERGLLAHKVAAETSDPSSPDIIQRTPTLQNNTLRKKDKFKKKDNRKRMEMLGLLACDFRETENELESESKSVVYAKDTQDVDETESRPVIKDNRIVPGTYNPSGSDLGREEENEIIPPRKGNQNVLSSTLKDASSRNEKENKQNSFGHTGVTSQKDRANERHLTQYKDAASLKKENRKDSPELKDLSPEEMRTLSPVFKDSQTRKVSSTSVLPLSTPKRPPRPRDTSPILGNSGSKKNCSKSFNTSGNKSKKSPENNDKDHRKDDSLYEQNASIEYRSGSNGKLKIKKQMSIQSSFSKSKSLSTNRNKKDISKEPAFNGGQRSAKELSLDITQMTEAEQIQFALEKSVQETTNNSIMEDSDLTFFVPAADQDILPKKKLIYEQSVREPKPPASTKGKPDVESENLVFQPIFASTEKEVHPTTKLSIHNQSLDFGNPLCASTEKDQMGNSALDMLAQHLEEEEEEKEEECYSGDCEPTYSNYDRLFKKSSSPKYAYKGPTVRKKAERRALPGMECTQCGEYFAMAFGDDSPDAKRQAIDSCSRHRGKYERVRSPPGYWDVALPPTQFMRERQERPID